MEKKREILISKEDKRRLEEIKQFIESGVEAGVGLRELSVRWGINRTKLSYGFKKLFGLSVHQFVIEIKMNQAYRMLKENDVPIKLIASTCGYSNTGNFYHAFKKYFGYSPATVKRQKGTL